jgi:post-segregation antitoxin (ccd killing protein)
MRARGPGDTENAMRALERDYGIDYWTTWKLRYRLSQVKDIGVTIYARLEAAYYAECASQRRKLALQIENRQAIARATQNPLVEAVPVPEEE